MSDIQTEDDPAEEGEAAWLRGWDTSQDPRAAFHPSRTLSPGSANCLGVSECLRTQGSAWVGFSHLARNSPSPHSHFELYPTHDSESQVLLNMRGLTAKLLLWKIPEASTASAFSNHL